MSFIFPKKILWLLGWNDRLSLDPPLVASRAVNALIEFSTVRRV